MELLTLRITEEYRNRAKALPPNGLQDTGARRELRKELQERCGITELQALNILNGYYAGDYVMIYARKAVQDAGEHKDLERLGGADGEVQKRAG